MIRTRTPPERPSAIEDAEAVQRRPAAGWLLTLAVAGVWAAFFVAALTGSWRRSAP